MTCSGPKYCLCSCSGGNCSTMFCEADTSKFDCAAGECETECYVQVEASLCSVTLTAAIRNVLVKPAKSTASQTAESNNVTVATASSCFRLASRITRYAMKTRPHAAHKVIRRLPAPVCPLRSHFLFFYHKCNW